MSFNQSADCESRGKLVNAVALALPFLGSELKHFSLAEDLLGLCNKIHPYALKEIPQTWAVELKFWGVDSQDETVPRALYLKSDKFEVVVLITGFNWVGKVLGVISTSSPLYRELFGYVEDTIEEELRRIGKENTFETWQVFCQNWETDPNYLYEVFFSMSDEWQSTFKQKLGFN